MNQGNPNEDAARSTGLYVSEDQSPRKEDKSCGSVQQFPEVSSVPDRDEQLEKTHEEDQGNSLSDLFIAIRESYVACLQDKRISANDGQSDTSTEVEGILNDISQGLSILFLFPACAISSNERPGACFSIRANRICQGIRKTIDLIKGPTVPDLDCGELLEIISLQIGRLTLDGYGCTDQSAIRSYNETTEFEALLQARMRSRDISSHKDQIIYQIWELMTRAVSFCDCYQCYRARISNSFQRANVRWRNHQQ